MAFPQGRSLLLMISGLALLFGLLIWQWDTIRSNPMVSAGASAFLMLVLGFAKKIWNELEPKWAKSASAWLEPHLLGQWVAFRHRYYRQLGYRHRIFNVRGLRTQGTFTLELEHVFVALRLVPQKPQQTAVCMPHGEIATVERSIWDFLLADHEAYRCLVVLGGPGTGKSTLLQYLALQFATKRARGTPVRCPHLVPILLCLREQATSIVSNSTVTIATLAAAQEQKVNLDPPTGWFENQLNANRCLILLDGIDEVADPRNRKAVVEWVDKQIEIHGGNRFIVTSRPQGYTSTPLQRATVLEVCPFDHSHIASFIEKWHLANEILSFGKDDEGVRARSADASRDLIRRICRSTRLAALATNPLLLTMIAMVHRYRGTLPEHRVDLYAEICDVLLVHWREAKGLTDALKPAHKRAVLQPLAFHMMCRRTQDIPIGEALKVVKNPLRRVGLTRTDLSAEFVRDVEMTSGLLIEREAGVYAFAHQTFQEYLAAAHCLDTQGEEDLITHLDDPWWRETICLYVALCDASRIIRSCLMPPVSTTLLLLAYECLGQAKTVDPSVRIALETEIISGLNAEDRERRRFAAELALARRLMNLYQSDQSVVVDSSYITCAEYQLFLDEQMGIGECRQPDHWEGLHFQLGSASTPVVGLRASDAIAFCGWLSSRAPADPGFMHQVRLPMLTDGVCESSSNEMSRVSVGVGAWVMKADEPWAEPTAAWRDGFADLRATVLGYLTRWPCPKEGCKLPGADGFAGHPGLDLDKTRTRDIARTFPASFDSELVRECVMRQLRDPHRAGFVKARLWASGGPGKHGQSPLVFVHEGKAFGESVKELDMLLEHAMGVLARVRWCETAIEQARTRRSECKPLTDREAMLDEICSVLAMCAKILDFLANQDALTCTYDTWLLIWREIFRTGQYEGVKWSALCNDCMYDLWTFAHLQQRLRGRLAAWECLQVVRERTPVVGDFSQVQAIPAVRAN